MSGIVIVKQGKTDTGAITVALLGPGYKVCANQFDEIVKSATRRHSEPTDAIASTSTQVDAI